jgi:hypothetical protein
LEEYANEGLRTLLIAEKIIPEDEYQEWNDRYKAACLTMNGREEAID